MQQYVNIFVEVCLIPLLAVLTKFIIDWLNAKREQIKETIKNDKADHYIDLIYDTVRRCVIATNQTYVETLKKENRFTAEAQQEAFHKTLNAVIDILSQDVLDYIVAASGDLETYLTQIIESQVALEK